jgi:di/tricarboxylate transporter
VTSSLLDVASDPLGREGVHMMLFAAVVILLVLVGLVREVASPAAVLLGGLAVLVLGGALPVEHAFAGLASPATISIAGLFIVARAVRDHVGLDAVLARLLGDGSRSERRVLMRFVPPVMLLSAVANNTPIVAVGAPVLRTWAERHGVAATRLLMPLSFATILGGTLTLIGTGTNLVVSALLTEAGHAPLGFFELTPLGAPVAAVGGAVILWLAPRVLPDRRTPHEQLASHRRDYSVHLVVEPNGPLDGLTLAEAGLRDLPAAYVASVDHGEGSLGPSGPETVLRGGDELVLVGGIESVQELLRRPGIREAEHAQTRRLLGEEHRLVECVIATGSDLVGRTAKDVAFRGRYGAAIIAIHRAGKRISGKLGTVGLRAGDSLLVLSEPAFVERWSQHRDFALLIPHAVEGSADDGGVRRWIAIITFVGMVVLAASGLIPVVHAIIVACAVLVATRTLSFGRAIAAIDVDIVLIVSAAIGIGAAITATGLSAALADSLTGPAIASPLATIVVVVVATMVLTELVTNVAAAALMLPVALDLASLTGTDPRGLALAVAVAASASFLTPLGYQTNTIVYGVGGYRFTDYWRLGLPVTIVTIIAIVVVTMVR